MKLTYVQGDLFNVFEELFKQGKNPVAAHCIAADFGMSGGIAAQFVKRMNMRALLHEVMADQGRKTAENPYDKGYGKTYVGIMGEAIRAAHVYNLITKRWTYEKPTYTDFITALESLRDNMVKAGENLLVIPKLGCGIDGMEWPAVNRLIKYTFGATNIHVIVCTPGELNENLDEAWKEVFGETYKGYQGEPLPG